MNENETYTVEDMLNFAWWFQNNLGQYSSDEHAHFEGKYLEMWEKEQNEKI